MAYDRMGRTSFPGLITATVVLAVVTWVCWALFGSRPSDLTWVIPVTVLLAANLAVTWASPRTKQVIVRAIQRYVLNPPITLLLRLGIVPPGHALLETRGRRSGLPRVNPVGEGRMGQVFWIIAEHGEKAGYVRNLAADPRVRVKVRDGLRAEWLDGIARIMPDDDPLLRQRFVCRWRPLRMFNALVVRVLGTDLLTIRIDLEPSAPAPAGSVHNGLPGRSRE